MPLYLVLIDTQPDTAVRASNPGSAAAKAWGKRFGSLGSIPGGLAFSVYKANADAPCLTGLMGTKS